MTAIRLKPVEEILPAQGSKILLLCCTGCRDVWYNQDGIDDFCNNITVSRTDITAITLPNVCNTDNIQSYQCLHESEFSNADTVIIISCGVGVQAAAEYFKSIYNDSGCNVTPSMPADTDKRNKNTVIEKKIIAACDTYPLPGYQGLTPSLFDCALCGECHLNNTAGICPITSCSKSLINGQCGGSKNGMCEVDPEMPCGWDRINKRIRISLP